MVFTIELHFGAILIVKLKIKKTCKRKNCQGKSFNLNRLNNITREREKRYEEEEEKHLYFSMDVGNDEVYFTCLNGFFKGIVV